MKTQPISRRSIAVGLALAPVAGLPALADASGPNVTKLWDDWRAFIADYLEADAKRDAAEKAMPFWAQPGPGRLYSDGSYRGEIIYAPLDITIQPPDRSDAFRTVRRTLADCRRNFEFRKNWWERGGGEEDLSRTTLQTRPRPPGAARRDAKGRFARAGTSPEPRPE